LELVFNPVHRVNLGNRVLNTMAKIDTMNTISAPFQRVFNPVHRVHPENRVQKKIARKNKVQRVKGLKDKGQLRY
jgi:hypothetical protein